MIEITDETGIVLLRVEADSLARQNLARAYLVGAQLAGMNLAGANLREADLRNANLCDANLQDAKLEGADLRGAQFDRADLARAELTDVNGQSASFVEANLSGAQLSQGEGDWRMAKFSRAILQDTHLSNLCLMHAWFDGADLSRASLWFCKLNWASFREARLERTSLSLCDLRVADLSGAQMANGYWTQPRLTMARFDLRTRWPRPWTWCRTLPVRSALILGGAMLLGSLLFISGSGSVAVMAGVLTSLAWLLGGLCWSAYLHRVDWL